MEPIEESVDMLEDPAFWEDYNVYLMSDFSASEKTNDHEVESVRMEEVQGKLE